MKYLLCCLLLLSFKGFAQEKYKVLSDSVEVRTCMKMNCDVTHYLKKDEVFSALKIEKQWLVLNIEGRELYTHQIKEVAPLESIYYVVNVDTLTVSACREAQCAAIAQLKKGQKIYPVSEENGWVKFQLDSLKQGFVPITLAIEKKVVKGNKVSSDLADNSFDFRFLNINSSYFNLFILVVFLLGWFLYIQRDLIAKIPLSASNQILEPDEAEYDTIKQKIRILANLFETHIYGITFRQGTDGAVKVKQLVKEIKALQPKSLFLIEETNKLIEITNQVLKRNFQGDYKILLAVAILGAVLYFFGWNISWLIYLGFWGVIYFFAALKPHWVYAKDFMQKDYFDTKGPDISEYDGTVSKWSSYAIYYGFRILILPILSAYYFYKNYIYSLRKVGLSSFLILFALLAFVLTYLQLSSIRYGSYKTSELLRKTKGKAFSDFDVLYHNSTYLSHSLLTDGKLQIHLSDDSLQRIHLQRIEKLFSDSAQYQAVLEWGKKLTRSCIDKHLISNYTSSKSLFDVNIGGIQTYNIYATSRRDKQIRDTLSKVNINPALAAHAAYQRITANSWVAQQGLDSITARVKKLVKNDDELNHLLKWAKLRGKQKEVTNSFTNLKYTVRPAPPEFEWFYYWTILDDWCLEKEAFSQRKKEVLEVFGATRKLTHDMWGNIQAIGKSYAEKRYKAKDNFLPPKSDRAYFIAALDVLSGIDPIVSDSSKKIFRDMFIDYEIIGGNIYNNFSLTNINQELSNDYTIVLDEIAISPFLYFYNSEDFFLRHSISPPALYPSKTPYAIIDKTIDLDIASVKSPELENKFTFLGAVNSIFTLVIAIIILILFHLFSLGVAIFLPQVVNTFLVDKFPQHFKVKLIDNPIFIKFRRESIFPSLNKKSRVVLIFTLGFLGYIFVSKWFGLNSEFILLHPHNLNFYLLFFLSVFFATFFINILTSLVANIITVSFMLMGKNPEESFWDDVLGIAMTFIVLAFYGYDPTNFWSEVLFGAIRPILINKTEAGIKNKKHIEYSQKIKSFLKKTNEDDSKSLS